MIEQDVQSGETTSSLLRPANYIALKLAEAGGSAAFRLFAFAPLMALFAFAITGSVPPTFMTILVMVPMMMAGVTLWLLMQLLIGMASAWLPVVRPIYMVVSKTNMVLGGLIVPVAMFPAAIRRWAFVTPCPALFYAPAGMILDSSLGHIARMAALQLAWLAVFLAVLLIAMRRFERRLIANEG